MADKKKPNPVLAYTKSAQDKDRQAVKDEYARKYDPTIKQTSVVIDANRFLGDAEKERAAKVSNYQTRMAKKGAIADQNRWIARGAKANAIALAKKNKKKVSKEAGWESMSGMSRAEKIAEMKKAGLSADQIKAALG